jgi:hypothetical protein
VVQKLSEVKAEERQRQKNFVRLFEEVENSPRSELKTDEKVDLFALGGAKHPHSSGNPYTRAQLQFDLYLR